MKNRSKLDFSIHEIRIRYIVRFKFSSFFKIVILSKIKILISKNLKLLCFVEYYLILIYNIFFISNHLEKLVSSFIRRLIYCCLNCDVNRMSRITRIFYQNYRNNRWAKNVKDGIIETSKPRNSSRLNKFRVFEPRNFLLFLRFETFFFY